MPKSIEAHGVTIDEAIQNALNSLGLGRDSVEIEILHHPRGGFLGIGARRAKVRATQREQVLRDGEEFDMAPGDAGRGRRRRRSGRRRSSRGGDSRVGAGAESEQQRGGGDVRRNNQKRADGGQKTGADAAQPQQQARQEGRGRRGSKPRGGDGRRSGEARQQRQRGDDRGRSAAGVESPDATQQKPRDEGRAEDSRGESRDRRRGGPPAPRPDPEVLQARATEVTQEVMVRMGYEATVEVSVTDGNVDVAIRASEGSETLIGRRGTTLDALEHLVNRMVSGPDPASRVRVNLDIDGYRAQRAKALGEVADRLRQHVLATGRKAQVTPLSPADRVVFQEALAGDDTVATRVLGSGFYRRVLVTPRTKDAAAGPAAEFTDEGQLLSSGDEPRAGAGGRSRDEESGEGDDAFDTSAAETESVIQGGGRTGEEGA